MADDFATRWSPVWVKAKELGTKHYVVHDDGAYKTGRRRGRALFADGLGQPLAVLEAMQMTSKQGKDYWVVRNDSDPIKETPRRLGLADVYG